MSTLLVLAADPGVRGKVANPALAVATAAAVFGVPEAVFLDVSPDPLDHYERGI